MAQPEVAFGSNLVLALQNLSRTTHLLYLRKNARMGARESCKRTLVCPTPFILYMDTFNLGISLQVQILLQKAWVGPKALLSLMSPGDVHATGLPTDKALSKKALYNCQRDLFKT